MALTMTAQRPTLKTTPAPDTALLSGLYARVSGVITPPEWAVFAPYIEEINALKKEMGAVITWGDQDDATNNYGLSNPGNIIHEAGTVRMGADKKSSALNAWGQAHDCKNLFCVDGSVFTSQADKNITWTILALSMRTSEYILDQLQKQNL